MIPLGLSAADLDAVEEQMRGSYRQRVLLGIMDFSHNWITQELAPARVSGAVQVRATDEGVTRSLSLEMFDPDDLLGLGNGAEGVSPNRMMSVRKGLFVDALNRWVDVPVFLGPITRPDRADSMLTIEAQDKASFATSHRGAYTIKAGTNLATAMTQVMRDVVGETRFRISPTSKKLVKTHTLSPDYTPWQFVQKVCRSLGWVAFYSADGYFTAGPQGTAPVASFRTGPGGSLVSQVKTGYWDGEWKNRVAVTGKVVAGVAVKATAELPESHALSAQSMAVGGVPYWQTEYVEDTDLGTTMECREVAEQRLAQLSVQNTRTEFETVPFWHLAEYEPFEVETASGMVLSSVDEMTIDLSAAPQSFGFLRATARASAFTVRTNTKTVQRAKARRR